MWHACIRASSSVATSMATESNLGELRKSTTRALPSSSCADVGG